MNNKTDFSKRTNIYKPSDASIAFILALLVPQIIMIIIYFILGKNVAANHLTGSLVPQISFLIVFFYVNERKKINYKLANQINFKIDVVILLLVILIGVISIFGFTPLTNLFDYITAKLGYSSVATNIDLSSFWKFFAAIFYVALLPAICEELIFRGIITNGLKKYGMATTILLSAVLFALMHQNLQQLIYQLFLGAIMAYIVLKTGSIIYTMTLHFFNNFLIIFLAFLSGESGVVDYSDPSYADYYGKAWNIIWPILLAVLTMAVVVGILFLIKYLVNRKSKSLLQNIETNNQEEAKDLSSKQPAVVEGISINNEQKTENNEHVDENPEQNLQKEGEQPPTYGYYSIWTLFGEADKHDKFYKNPFVISALVVGLIFWVLTVISCFK